MAEKDILDSFLIVGIGASAGGLKASGTFFRHMDDNSDMAFILISHLDSNSIEAIADTGIGIESEALSRIFIPFSQENRELAGSEGLGLDLPLAKGIIELHDGKIAVNSARRDRGTEFTIELSVTPEGEEKVTQSEESTAISIAKDNKSTELTAVGDESSQKRERCRVLIVEDELDSASLLQIFLEDYGYQVEVAFNGIDGIELAQQFSPDVILSDINLIGEMDGYTLARTIRNDSKLNSISLIAISGYGQPEDKKAAEAAGFDTHLTKPLDLEQVQSAIAQTITKKGIN